MKNTKDILVKEPALILLLSACLWAAFSFRNEKGWSNVYTKPYVFTSDTFTDRIPFWTKDLEEFKGKPAIQFLEIGTFEGRSALWVLENILTDPTSSLTVIDTFDGPYYKTFLHNVNLSGQSARFKILAGYSTEKIKEVPLHSIDFAYIDGSADGNVMFEDLKNAWDRVKVGGIILCNRYRLTSHLRRVFGLHPGDPGPREAIDRFIAAFKPYISIIDFQPNFVVLRKLQEATPASQRIGRSKDSVMK